MEIQTGLRAWLWASGPVLELLTSLYRTALKVSCSPFDREIWKALARRPKHKYRAEGKWPHLHQLIKCLACMALVFKESISTEGNTTLFLVTHLPPQSLQWHYLWLRQLGWRWSQLSSAVCGWCWGVGHTLDVSFECVGPSWSGKWKKNKQLLQLKQEKDKLKASLG